jgi:hypothetical protein
MHRSMNDLSFSARNLLLFSILVERHCVHPPLVGGLTHSHECDLSRRKDAVLTNDYAGRTKLLLQSCIAPSTS